MGRLKSSQPGTAIRPGKLSKSDDFMADMLVVKWQYSKETAFYQSTSVSERW